ncbi:MAG: glycosyltransferase family 39 protein [Elusimicrobia bacterium]|nr:glycosyltransferase family 39 protein [Elusimicrobiota bacterium]
MLRPRQSAALAAGAAVLAALPVLDKAWHIDEPFFLAVASQILADPLHPLSFAFNWYGWTMPMAALNNTPPLWGYMLAAAASVAGGAEWTMRLCFLPLDALCAAALYAIARRFLERPLLPVLLCLAAPAYLVDMQLLMAEKPMAAFGLCGLWALLAALETGGAALLWASAGLLGLAVLSKYAGILFLAPAVVLLSQNGVGWRRIAAYLALAISGIAAYFLWDALTAREAFGAAWRVSAEAARWPWAPFKLRSVLAFVGGASPLFWFWPSWETSRKTWVAAALASLLFLPIFDTEAVRLADRLLGAFLAAAAAGTLVSLARGRAVWTAWAGAVLFLLAVVYWSVLARLSMFLVPPLVFAACERLERRNVLAAALALSCLLSAGLSAVDYRYAAAQREQAVLIKEEFLDRGRAVWYSGHWGFQQYMDAAGARQIDRGRGGWEQAKAGDLAVIPRVNSNVAFPPDGVPETAVRRRVEHRLPLRLISGWDGQGGFYSNTFGFLPYSVSTEPLEEFRFFEVR